MVLQAKSCANLTGGVVPVIGNEHVGQAYAIAFGNFVGVAACQTLQDIFGTLSRHGRIRG
jgi:hypothetical protein